LLALQRDLQRGIILLDLQHESGNLGQTLRGQALDFSDDLGSFPARTLARPGKKINPAFSRSRGGAGRSAGRGAGRSGVCPFLPSVPRVP
jgi:hypothetical protein